MSGLKIWISDTHLGDGSKADDFHRDDELIGLLNFAERHGAELHLLGDIYELWQAHLDKIIWAHTKLYKRIISFRNKRFIFGNHDAIPFEKLWFEYYEDDKIYAEHGHQYDMFNKHSNPMNSLKKPKTPIGKYITQVVGLLERFWHRDADIRLLKLREKYGSFLYRAAELQNKKPYQELSPVKPGKKVTIHGHTHKAKLIKFSDGSIHANCGTWVDGTEPTYILTNNFKVELRNGLNHKVIKEEWFDGPLSGAIVE